MDLNEILQKIGWTNGFHVPIANEENQALEAELERLALRKAKAKIDFDEANAKYDAMDKHLKYVRQESEQNQKLMTAYAQQISSERQKLKQSKAEQDRINQEIKQINKNVEDIERRQETKRDDLTKALTKIEKLKAETMWDTEALKAWEDSLKKRVDDVDLLKNYSKLDERRAKDLDARRQLLQMEVCEKKETVERMVAEIRNYEQMQERTNKLFKQQDEERKALVLQWQDAVKNLRQRDEDIQKINKDIIQTQEIIAEKQEELNEHDTFLNNEKTNNKKLTMEIDDLNAINSRMRRELNDLIQHVLTLGNDVNTVKRNLAAVSSKLEQERQVSKDQEKELQTIRTKMTSASLELEELMKKLEDVLSTTMSSTERSKRLDQMIKVDQQMTKNLTLDAEKMQGVLYRNQIALQELKHAMKSYEMEITRIEMANKNMQKQIKVKSDDVGIQQEMVYSLEYRMNEIEVKIASIEDQAKVDEKTEIMNEKIAELEEILAQHNEVKAFLHGQVNRLEDEMRRLGTAIAGDAAKLDVLKDKLQDQMLLFDGGIKQAAAAKLRAQQKQVEENLLRLRVFQLEQAMQKEANDIYDLQKFRLQLETSLKEREIQIQAHQDILQGEKKNLEESKGRLKADLAHKRIRIEQFQKKHHLALMALGRDEDGQPLSITHFKIKDAQERYMLQQEGDELDNKIKKAEKEIVAMENTLKVVNITNAVYRKSLDPFEEDDQDRLEMKRLEQEICNTATVLRQLKKSLSQKRKSLLMIQSALTDAEVRHEEEFAMLEDAELTYVRLKQEHSSREERLANTLHNVKKYKKRAPKEQLEKPERNLEIRQLQEANNDTFRRLQILISDCEDVTYRVLSLLNKYNLEMPSGPKSRSSTSSSSIAPLTHTGRSSTSSSSVESCSALTPIMLSFGGDVKKEKDQKIKKAPR